MPTIAGSLRSTAHRVPDAEALLFGDRSLTYRELDAEVDRYAAALRASGVAQGDRVCLMSGNSDLFVLAFYAVQRLGAVFVPVNPASAPPEVAHLMADSGATVLLVAGPLLDRVPDGTPSMSLEDLAAAAAAATPYADDADVLETDDALILYTSGTTGKPKGALFDHRRSMLVAMSLVPSLGMRAGDRFLHVAPLYHAAELAIMLVPGTVIGVKHVVLPSFDPAAVLEVMERERVTMFFGVPTMFQLMMRVPGAADRDLSAWRTGLFGAAPMPAHAIEQMVGTWPGVAFMQLCGQTEAGPSGIYSTHEQVLERPDASGRQGVVFTEARVVDEDFEDVAPGGTGELLLRSETVMKGYWNNPDATEAAFHDGWLRTGDIARLDADGYMTLVDRLKDMIITGGRNVYSIEVENVLAGHPDVVDAAVVARPHPDFGESIVAVVTLADGASLTLDELRDHCRPLIADYKIPHDLVVTSIPRNASGKILKHQLRAQLV
ncbi:AMP-binding protein [Nocardioides sp. CN2-186]|uniref:class I adenylate-forming enzyme family protein n=1 Tax=Nocardioides tweenelious TaxID=3156607 RepID=UPI0032B5F7FA